MSAPSAAHERLRTDLDALAILSGHRHVLYLAEWLRPDVARCDLTRLRIFIGDAKATETPSNAETLRRLRSYFAPVAQAIRLGLGATFAVAHADPEGDWLTELNWLAARLGLDVAEQGRDVLSADATISWLLLGVGRIRPAEVQGSLLAA